MTFIIGLNAFHGDSSACILKDNLLIAAAEEERFRRVKHWAGFPSESIRFCLDFANITLEDVDHICINTSPFSNFSKKLVYAIKNRPDPKYLIQRFKNRKERRNLKEALRNSFKQHNFSGKIHFIDHHYSHLSSAHHVSSFDESVCVSVDGFGDFSSGAWGVGHNNTIDIIDSFLFPHSLGIFYQALTQYLGFPHYGDEYKVMGLAPYGKPKYLNQLRKVVQLSDNGSYKLNLSLFNHHKGNVSFEWSGGAPDIGSLYSPQMEDIIGIPPRSKGQALEKVHHDLAHSVQAMYEEAFFHLLDVAHKRTGLNNLSLAGGCAMNSVANGKVYRRSPFKKLYVQSAAGDAGGAIGSAYAVAEKLNLLKKSPRYAMNHAYLGPEYDTKYISGLINRSSVDLENQGCSSQIFDDHNLLCSRVAQDISNGKVVGWFQGRMEWGPRALGNRSILGDPRRENMKDILNLKIKRRESFRPFAPSILRECVFDWFEEDDDVPFMMQVFQVRKEKRDKIPAVTHVDGSGRLQTVEESTNIKYFNLIKEFYKLTGVPIVLNTSFNENEPVVCKPEEALACFLRTKMDVLVLNNYIISRN